VNKNQVKGHIENLFAGIKLGVYNAVNDSILFWMERFNIPFSELSFTKEELYAKLASASPTDYDYFLPPERFWPQGI
jgi:hypothetical protein